MIPTQQYEWYLIVDTEDTKLLELQSDPRICVVQISTQTEAESPTIPGQYRAPDLMLALGMLYHRLADVILFTGNANSKSRLNCLDLAGRIKPLTSLTSIITKLIDSKTNLQSPA